MREELRKALEGIDLDEAREVVELLASRFSSLPLPDEPLLCPWCGADWLVKKGHDRDGGQRYQCCSCGRTFNPRTRGVPPKRKPSRPHGAGC